MIAIVFTLLLQAQAQTPSVDLIQETQDIICSNQNISVFIDKKDRFIRVSDQHETREYFAVEFLDTGILLKAKTSKKHSLLQLTPKNTALLIEGDLMQFKESNCRDTGASKICQLEGSSLFWSSESLGFDSNNKKMNYDISHYGIHPNDGTYFMALNEASQQALGLLDFGMKLSLVKGASTRLQCRYQ